MIIQPEVRRSSLLTAERDQKVYNETSGYPTVNFLKPKVRLQNFNQTVLVIATNSMDRLWKIKSLQ